MADKTFLIDDAIQASNNDIFTNDVAFYRLHGQQTGTKVKVLGSNMWLFTTTFFDDRGRIIQTQGDNHMGGTDITSTDYDFAGKVLRTRRWHSTSNHSIKVIEQGFTYDHGGRVETSTHKIDNHPTITLTSNTYNELGQLIDKGLHSTNGENFLQNVDYRYNIRGWLTDINDLYFGNLTPEEIVEEIARGVVDKIENQKIKVDLDKAALNSGTYEKIEVGEKVRALETKDYKKRL